MQEELTLLTGMGLRQREEALRWMARQAEDIRTKVMSGRFRIYKRLGKHQRVPASVLDYAALLLACKDAGFGAETKFRSSSPLNASDQKTITACRTARAMSRTQHLAKLREYLAVKWGEVVELKGAGVSYRGIALHFQDEYGLSVSHTTIHNLWRCWQDHGTIPVD